MCEMCVQGCELVVNQAFLSKTTISDVEGTDADFAATFFFSSTAQWIKVLQYMTR